MALFEDDSIVNSKLRALDADSLVVMCCASVMLDCTSVTGYLLVACGIACRAAVSFTVSSNLGFELDSFI